MTGSPIGDDPATGLLTTSDSSSTFFGSRGVKRQGFDETSRAGRPPLGGWGAPASIPIADRTQLALVYVRATSITAIDDDQRTICSLAGPAVAEAAAQ